MSRRKASDWRVAHGRAAELGRVVVLEAGRDRELAPAESPTDPVRPDRDKGGKFLPGNKWARLAKHRAGPSGLLAALDAKADPEWRASRRWGRRAAGHRIAELAQMFGGELSSVVCGLTADAWTDRADARYLSARAAADNNPELLRVATQLRASARQAERDAWEFATREAQTRPKAVDGVADWQKKWFRP